MRHVVCTFWGAIGSPFVHRTPRLAITTDSALLDSSARVRGLRATARRRALTSLSSTDCLRQDLMLRSLSHNTACRTESPRHSVTTLNGVKCEPPRSAPATRTAPSRRSHQFGRASLRGPRRRGVSSPFLTSPFNAAASRGPLRRRAPGISDFAFGTPARVRGAAAGDADECRQDCQGPLCRPTHGRVTVDMTTRSAKASTYCIQRPQSTLHSLPTTGRQPGWPAAQKSTLSVRPHVHIYARPIRNTIYLA
jgi:hypothetical protein